MASAKSSSGGVGAVDQWTVNVLASLGLENAPSPAKALILETSSRPYSSVSIYSTVGAVAQGSCALQRSNLHAGTLANQIWNCSNLTRPVAKQGATQQKLTINKTLVLRKTRAKVSNFTGR